MNESHYKKRIKRRNLNIAFAVVVPILLCTVITVPILYGKITELRFFYYITDFVKAIIH